MALCELCERPLQVRVDPARLTDRDIARARERSRPDRDPLDALLEAPGERGFARRFGAAFLVLAVGAAIVLAGTHSVVLALFAALLLALPAAAWGPALVAQTFGRLLRRIVAEPLARRAVRPPVWITTGRWDQWLREGLTRERERAEQPEAVLVQLARVLDERELRRVRALAVEGVVPAAQLDELLRMRTARLSRRSATGSSRHRTG